MIGDEKLTLTKLAKLANVSVSTASKAFSMSSEVNEETREAVFEAARKSGCFRRFFNAKYPKPTVTVICPEFFGRFYSGIASELERAFRESGCDVSFSTTDFSDEKTEDLVSYYDRYTDSDLLIVMGNAPEGVHREIPIIQIGGGNDDTENADGYIRLEFEQAMREVIGSLCRSGVKSVGFIGEKHTYTKQHLINELLKEYNFDSMRVSVSAERFEKGGYTAVETMLNESLPFPEALICAYDYMAIGAVRKLNEVGIAVPEQVSVFGMDDLPECEYLTPSLSSVGWSGREISSAAVKLALDILDGKSENCKITVRASANFRESSGRINRSPVTADE